MRGNNFINIDSPLMQRLSFFADLIILNVLAVLCSIPVFTIGAVWSALYVSVEKLCKDEGRVFRTFFMAIRTNFKQATILWLLALASGLAILYGVLFLLQDGSKAQLILSAASLLLWGSVASWIFPLQAKFSNPVTRTLQNGVLCTLAFLFRSLMMAFLNLVPVCLLILVPDLFLRVSFVWLLIWFSLVTLCNLSLLKKPYTTLINKKEE